MASDQLEPLENNEIPNFIGAALLAESLVLVLLVAGIGWLSLRTIGDLHSQALSLSENQWRDVLLANQAVAYSNQNSRILLQATMIRDRSEIDALLATQSRNSARISQLLKQLEGRIGSGNEQRSFDAVVAARTRYLESCQTITQILLKEKGHQRARESLIRATLPLLQKYLSAWDAYVEFQNEELNEQLAASSERYATIRKRTLILMNLAGLLTLGIVVGAIRTIVAENRRRKGEELRIRRQNQELECKVLQRTEELVRLNNDLNAEIVQRKQTEAKLRLETAFFQALTNSAQDGILVVDGERKKILQNRMFREMFNIPRSVLENPDDKASLEYVMAQFRDPESFLRKVNYLYDHKDESSSDELQLADGKTFYRSSSPVAGDGRYYGRIWIFHDVTQLKRNDDTMRSLSLAVEQSPVSVVITDLSGNITYVNRCFVQSTGYECEEVLGKNSSILKSGHTSKEDYQRLWNAITAGDEWRGEFQNRKKNGELYWESVVIRPIKNEKGAITHFLAIKEDITERRTMEVQLRQAQKLEAIGRLAAGIAHEINTPTQYIGDNVTFLTEAFQDLTKLVTGCGRLLAAAKANTLSEEVVQEVSLVAEGADVSYLLEEIPKALAQTDEGVGRVSKIVRAMKEFSHPGTDTQTPTDLNRAIESTFTVTRNEWKYVAELEADFDTSLPPIPCLPGEFNQVILNLIVNAAHAVGEVVGEGRVSKGKIRVQTLNCEDWAEIRIEDSGPGIPSNFHARIFEPFFTTKEVGKGTGQGLAMARYVVVEKHKGSIHFETAQGKGTTFVIRLPKEGKSVPTVARGANA